MVDVLIVLVALSIFVWGVWREWRDFQGDIQKSQRMRAIIRELKKKPPTNKVGIHEYINFLEGRQQLIAEYQALQEQTHQKHNPLLEEFLVVMYEDVERELENIKEGT